MKALSQMLLSLLAAAPLAGCSDGPCDPEAPNTICTIVGNGEQGFNGDDGPATSAALYITQATAVAPDGELWVLDFNNYVVRSVDAAGIIRTRIGNGQIGDSPAPDVPKMPALAATFNHTTDLFFHDGYIYLSAWHNSRVKRVNLATMEIENYAGLGRRTYFDGDGGPALQASLDLPSAIALDLDQNIVIMDQANQVIRKIDAVTSIMTTIAGQCVVEELERCTVGEVPAACPSSNKFTCGDIATECSKPCTPSYGGDDGPALSARMSQPFNQWADPAGRLVYDHDGNLIFADTENHRLRKVDPSGRISTFAGTGTPGYSGDGGPSTAAQIFHPVDVVVGDDNTVYFTDVYNNCVRKIDPSGTISRVVGRCSPDPDDRGFSGDGGDPLDAKLDRPYGIDLHGKKLYVSDSYNNRVRVVNLP